MSSGYPMMVKIFVYMFCSALSNWALHDILGCVILCCTVCLFMLLSSFVSRETLSFLWHNRSMTVNYLVDTFMIYLHCIFLDFFVRVDLFSIGKAINEMTSFIFESILHSSLKWIFNCYNPIGFLTIIAGKSLVLDMTHLSMPCSRIAYAPWDV